MRHIIVCILCAMTLILPGMPVTAQQPAPQLKIDIDVVLKQAKVVFNMDHLAFDGAEPFGLQYMRIMQETFTQNKTEWQIVAIFHGKAGYMLLNDMAYDRHQKVSTGNPYAKQIAALQKGGVRFEECGQTARDNKWVNADLLPAVAVNSGANFRIVQLVQDGFVQIQP